MNIWNAENAMQCNGLEIVQLFWEQNIIPECHHKFHRLVPSWPCIPFCIVVIMLYCTIFQLVKFWPLKCRAHLTRCYRVPNSEQSPNIPVQHWWFGWQQQHYLSICARRSPPFWLFRSSLMKNWANWWCNWQTIHWIHAIILRKFLNRLFQ